MRTPMTDEMRQQVREAIHRLTVTYRQRKDSIRKEYEDEMARLEDMLDCSVVPRTKL